MPTEKQQWLEKYNTYFAATEYNRKHYGKRIKQLKKMLEDEKFLEFLSDRTCKQDILTYLAKSNEFDMYIAFNENREFTTSDIMKGLNEIIPLAQLEKKKIQTLQQWALSGRIRTASSNF